MKYRHALPGVPIKGYPHATYSEVQLIWSEAKKSACAVIHKDDLVCQAAEQ